MTPEVLAHAFELFYQADQTLDRPQGGLGLGLTLVQRLALLHGGSVTASSGGPGRGSEFQLRLPAPAPAPPGPAPRAEGAGAPGGARKHVLIVDDDRSVRMTSEMLLTAMNYRVSMAATGEKGVEQAMALHPDIALIDLGMPGLDGLEVAARIRAELGRDIYLVALTGYSRESDIAKTKAAGFDKHLVKSGDPRELLELLQSI
jgi:CheY-like chemotaxis protein